MKITQCEMIEDYLGVSMDITDIYKKNSQQMPTPTHLPIKEKKMETVELKRCPFCGGEAVLEPYKVRKGYEANIQCNGGCLALMRTITYDTEEEAIENVIKAWNRRVEDDM